MIRNQIQQVIADDASMPIPLPPTPVEEEIMEDVKELPISLADLQNEVNIGLRFFGPGGSGINVPNTGPVDIVDPNAEGLVDLFEGLILDSGGTIGLPQLYPGPGTNVVPVNLPLPNSLMVAPRVEPVRTDTAVPILPAPPSAPLSTTAFASVSRAPAEVVVSGTRGRGGARGGMGRRGGGGGLRSRGL